MGRAKKIKEAVKDYIWGDGLDFWNTPSHKVHDFPFTNPLHDIVIWNTGGKGVAALAEHHMEKLLSGDYNDMLMHPLGGTPAAYKPVRESKKYKSSSSSLSSYQQNGGGGDTSKRSASYRIPGSPSKFTGRFKDGHNDHWRGVTQEWIRNPCKKGYRPDKINGKWVCRKGTWSSYKKDLKSGRL